jgi:oligoendopeptidase F
MRFLILCLLMVSSLAVLAGSASGFEPLTPAQKKAYRFDLTGNFYADDVAWKADMDRAREMMTRIEAYRGKVLESASRLLDLMNLQRDLEDLMTKLFAYGEFREAVNTADREAFDAYERLKAEEDSRTSFFQVELKGLSETKLQDLLKAEPGLTPYRYLLEDTVRMGPHTLSEERESILATLGPDLTSWQPALFQLTFDRTPFQKIEINGKSYDAYRDLDSLLQNPDRDVRERAFRGTYATFDKISDLLGFSLYHEMNAYNEQARMRGFDTYFNEALFERYLSRPQIDNLYAQIESHLPIYHAYQRYRMDQVEAQLGVKEAEIWDMELPSKGDELPRFSADQGVKAVEESLAVLGPEYSRELGLLLDPKNGRMDIVGGPGRRQGAFTEGYFGYFMDNYQGLLGNVSTMAHEAGHAIHHRLVANHQGALIFSEGPAYMTESFAMFNEWLLRDHLIKTEKDPAVAATYRRDALNEMMYLWELARRAKFEMVAYDRVAAGAVTGADGFDTVCEETGKPYDLFFARTPELKLHWIRKHHYWSVPTYYINYVLAHVLAMTYYQHYLDDPAGFPAKYTAMVAAGFQKPAAEMLKEYLGIDFGDPKLLDRTFAMIQKQFDEVKHRGERRVKG